MQAQQAHLKFSEAEQPRGDRLLKIALETDRVEGYSEPHSILIARLATSLAERMGIHGIELTGLKFAALAHDIGERAMKRNYLLHSYELTWEETLDLWRHPILGEQVAAELGLSRLTQLLIRWHHEWWNGHGYPDSLQGHAIPLAARILRVVDSYCALISNRPHRMRFAPSEAEQIIADLAGIEFDPHVVKMMLEMLGEKQRNRQPEIRSSDPEPEIYSALTPQEPQPTAGLPEAEPYDAVLRKQEVVQVNPELYSVPTFQESQSVTSEPNEGGEPKPESVEVSLRGQEFIEPEPEMIEIALNEGEYIEPNPDLYPVSTFREMEPLAGAPAGEPDAAATSIPEYLEEVIILEDQLAISEAPLPADQHTPTVSEPLESGSETRDMPLLEPPPDYLAEESSGRVKIPGHEQEEEIERPASKSEG
ncbi:MAG: HD domain-containing protein [Acidobacteria bacterium]|nr:HD domain-containing protein [Acidobacteriota bacterium]